VPDFAGEPARRVFGEYHGKALIDVGVSGFKLDECDGSDFTEGWSWPDFSRFPSGLDGEQMHAAFGLRYQHAVLDAFQKRNLPTFGLVRSSGALAAPYPFVLYSDLYDHRQFIRAMLNAGFSGLLWCPEVRDAISEEDLLRRLQSVVFSPLAMVNAWYIRNPPWKQIEQQRNNADDFNKGWESLENRCREILGWRMAMVPYLRSAFAQYAANGTPVFRAPILDFPDDPSLGTVDDQYMVGDRLLVAPLFAGEPGRAVVLPSGDWHDFWTGEHIAGGQNIRVSKSFQRIPVYVRGNALVPWAEVSASSNDPGTRRLHVRVYGDGRLGWQGRGLELEGLSLTWNAATSQGHATNAPRNGRPYEIVAWDRIG
jgi:alpha-D-xyloside xylohydrolase